MNIKLLAVFVVIGSLVAGPVNTDAAEDHASNQVIKLSPGLVDLLRAEMREISGGVQGVPLSLATADWESIQQTSANLRASYIMEKKLTSAQAHELERALPQQFKQLDSEFHLRAEKLGAAAAAHDTELVVFHYSRLLESCARCHSAFASKRFPGFTPPAPKGHQH
jgi:cytochrome c556